MHAKVREEFRRVLAARGAGGAVLEIGARPIATTLLAVPELRGASERIGLDLDGPYSCDGFEIVRGDANRMDFPAARFDTVLCNSVLEHDLRFWLTMQEIRRVAKPGALVVIGAPAFGEEPPWPLFPGMGFLRRFPIIGPRLVGALASTPTLHIHNFPHDYYRFSAQAMRDLFFEGLVDVDIRQVMQPPRVVGAGRMPS